MNNAMNAAVKLTREGIEQVRRELEREQGRLAEATFTLADTMTSPDNYDSEAVEFLKKEKAEIENRIDVLEVTLERATVIDGPGGGDTVDIGSYVRLQEETSGREMEVRFVSGLEVTMPGGTAGSADRVVRASDDSPLGLKLAGRKVGDVFTVDVERGQLRYRVLSVNNQP